MFCAHLDTVPHEGADRGRLDDGRLPQRRRDDPRRRQQGGGRRAAGAGGAPRERARRPVGIELLFTVAEEQGAARSQGVRRLGAALGVRLRPRPREPDRRGDHRLARPTSGSTPSSSGAEAHAGIRPEDGPQRDRRRAPPRSRRWSSGGSTRRRRRTSA